jgi:hypothetical protein
MAAGPDRCATGYRGGGARLEQHFGAKPAVRAAIHNNSQKSGRAASVSWNRRPAPEFQDQL